MHAASAKCSLDIIYHNKRYSWDDLCSRLEAISNSSNSSYSSYSSNRSLAVISRDRFSIFLCLLYAFFNKHCCYPVSPSISTDYLKHLLVQSDSTLVLGDKNMLSMARSVKQLPLDDFLVQVNHSSGSGAEHSSYLNLSNELLSEHRCALLINTSGSLTEPKIVKLSYQNIFHHVQSFTQSIPITSQSLWLNCLPLEHIAGAMIVYRCLLTNAGMLLDNDFDEKQVWHEINAYPVTHLSLVPLMLKRILDYTEHAPPARLKYVLVGGDTIPPALYQRAKQSGWPLVISYGMTEACSTIALGKSPEKLQLLAGLKKQINNKGELMLQGPMVMSGYITSGPDNITPLKDNWFNTHDLVSSNGNFIRITGRADNRIISGGETIAPQLIEQLLSEFPGMDDVAVGKISHPDWGNSIVALVQGDVEQLTSWVEQHLDKKFRPRFYIEHKIIPRNPSGKINRFKVQSIIKQRSAY